MPKTGYLVIEHDIDSCGIYFLEKNVSSDRIISILNGNYDAEYIQEKWVDFMDWYINKYNADPEYCHPGNAWPFNGYDIILLADVYMC